MVGFGLAIGLILGLDLGWLWASPWLGFGLILLGFCHIIALIALIAL